MTRRIHLIFTALIGAGLAEEIPEQWRNFYYWLSNEISDSSKGISHYRLCENIPCFTYRDLADDSFAIAAELRRFLEVSKSSGVPVSVVVHVRTGERGNRARHLFEYLV